MLRGHGQKPVRNLVGPILVTDTTNQISPKAKSGFSSGWYSETHQTSPIIVFPFSKYDVTFLLINVSDI